MRALRALGLALLTLVLTSCTAIAVPSIGWPSFPAPAAPSTAPAAVDPESKLPWIELAALPAEGRTVYHQIAAGGPFRYRKDGSLFLNSERVLPRQPRGYYREYTVPTPGESTRGARRIVCGGTPVTSTSECYYTDDHYRTFRRIRP